MSILDTFVTIDLETTGLSPKDSEILEIGAVKVESGKVLKRFQTYIKPISGIPDEVVRLTGITNDHVKEAPKAKSALDRLREFVGELPLIAFQGRFEERFLTAHSLFPVENAIHGVRDLARAALPCLGDHSAPGLAKHFGSESTSPHRALRDAEGLAATYLGTVEALRDLSLQLKQQMLQLLQGTDSSLLPILVELGNEAVQKEFLSRKPGGGVTTQSLKAMFNVAGDESDRAATGASRTAEALDVDEIRALFEPGGAFSDAIPDYEHRTEQIQMAEAVSEAINNDRFLAVEAGTGVGKSIAYLVPAVLDALKNGRRFVISTNTKNLQEQLFFNDLPTLKNVLDVPFTYALVKGRANYICLNRWDTALESLESTFSEEERLAALPLVVWAGQTRTGDITENTAFDTTRGGSLWAKVCSDSGFCRSQRCRTNGRCFAGNIRKAAQRSHIVVVNHALLFADIASENAILGEYEHLILDEAHNVEKIAAHYLGRELTMWRVKNLTDQLRSTGFTSTGTLPALRHWISVAKVDDATAKAFDAGISSATGEADELWERTQTFFQALTDRAAEAAGGRTQSYIEKLRYKPEEPAFDSLQTEIADLAEVITGLGERLESLAGWLRNLPADSFPGQDDFRGEMEGRIEECASLMSDLGYLTRPEDDRSVYWMELPGRENSIDTRLMAVPLDVSDLLHDALYGKMRSIIFTSATLGIRGKLTYFLIRMGLDALPEERLMPLCLGSPFDYDHQALVCAPDFVPSPKAPEFQEAVNQVLEGLALGARKGTLALFTSYRMLNRSYSALKAAVRAEDILVLGQGIDGSRTSITDRFRLNEKAVLLGTDSFWEGIDIPGDALQILVIVRLPFAVPTDPLVAAHMEELEKQGKNPFMHYSVPEAILKFRQGFGRLIRKKTDRGAVVVLDSRVLTTRYGKAFLEALPVSYRRFKREEDLISAVRSRFEEDE
jgi:ATP-dependent DNA helicase DinG